jgi:glycine/betaine/sarcosine/D-proline reductase family selenoprotein B
LPAVLITAMTAMARTAGANRILGSGKIPHPTGAPERTPDEEAAWRRGVIKQALETLSDPIQEVTVY